MTPKWICFEHLGYSKSGKTSIFAVLSKDSEMVLGRIAWHVPWRCYAFFPAIDTFFERICLRDILEFIISLTGDARRGKT